MSEMSFEDRRLRLLELLADDRIGQIDPVERAELESLVAGLGDEALRNGGDGPTEMADLLDEAIGRALVALDALDDSPGMPASVRDRLARRGLAWTGSDPIPMPTRRSGAPWLVAAASVLLAVGVGAFAYLAVERQEARLAEARASAEERIAENQRLLADAQAELALMSGHTTELERRNLDLVTRLADATSRLDEAELAIARYETPEDPAVLAANREKLLDLNGTFSLAWQPFDVAGLPDTEQRGVSGDVVWNDDLQQGFMRFVGLRVNDPSQEQYQVWVIDERGMEQKVSGGVFNATADGEVIVPIHPGIDVGRVQVFAITVEDTGGTWVPDLKRRVVVAPREGG